MDKLDNEQFAVDHYLQSLLKQPETEQAVEMEENLGKKLKVMRFRVGKLQCAVEHRTLAGVQLVLEAITPWPKEAPPWLLGYMAESVQQAKIIDLNALIQGEPATQPQLQGEQRLIALQKGRFALVADEVLGGGTVFEQQVTWRDESSSRPWLAGIHKESGLVILDAAGLEAMLPS